MHQPSAFSCCVAQGESTVEDVSGDVDQSRLDFLQALNEIFTSSRHHELLYQAHRTFRYAKQFPWNRESGEDLSMTMEKFLTDVLSAYAHLSTDPRVTKLVIMPDSFKISEEPSYQDWIDQITQSIPKLVNDEHSFNKVLFFFNRQLYGHGLNINPEILERYIINGISRYIRTWQVADSNGF